MGFRNQQTSLGGGHIVEIWKTPNDWPLVIHDDPSNLPEGKSPLITIKSH